MQKPTIGVIALAAAAKAANVGDPYDQIVNPVANTASTAARHAVTGAGIGTGLSTALAIATKGKKIGMPGIGTAAVAGGTLGGISGVHNSNQHRREAMLQMGIPKMAGLLALAATAKSAGMWDEAARGWKAFDSRLVHVGTGVRRATEMVGEGLESVGRAGTALKGVGAQMNDQIAGRIATGAAWTLGIGAVAKNVAEQKILDEQITARRRQAAAYYG